MRQDGCIRRLQESPFRLLAAGVLGDGLGSLGNGVLGKLSWQQEADRGLNLTRSDSGPLVVVSQPTRFGSDSFEQIIDERVHDAHRLGRDTGVGVDLLQHL